jgi:hypothetical protein
VLHYNFRDEAENHQRLQQQQQEADQARMLQDDVDIAGLEDDLIEVGFSSNLLSFLAILIMGFLLGGP